MAASTDMTELAGNMTLANLIDKITKWANDIASLALLLMTLFVTYEVVARYFFNSPTIWAWDLNVQLMVMVLMLGFAEVLRQDLHVRVDVVLTVLPARVKTWLDILFAPIFLFIVIMLTWSSWKYFSASFSRLEHASTVLSPPLYPVKFFLPLGAALLVLQGALKLYRDIRKLRKPELHSDQGDGA